MGREPSVDQADISLREFCKAAKCKFKTTRQFRFMFRVAVEENAIGEHNRRTNVTKQHAG